MKKASPKRIAVVDSSLLARNMYRVLFAPLGSSEIECWENSQSVKEKKKPDLLIVNSNAIPRQAEELPFPSAVPMILLMSPDRNDLKERFRNRPGVSLIEKPFYPYDLLSEMNRLLGSAADGRRRN
ncbi:MAG: response regulator [Deltaproteobacteria bacterium]|nr:response regulator [Deltaproteobacteria bacterium]